MKRFVEWLFFDERTSSRSIDEWVEWQVDFKRCAPIHYWFWNNVYSGAWLTLRCKIKRAIDSVKYRTIEKYHVVDLNLAPEYYSPSDRMLHACFSLLDEYVEKSGVSALNTDSEYIQLVDLYEWYKRREYRESQLKPIPHLGDPFEDECIFYAYSERAKAERPEFIAQREEALNHNAALYRFWHQQDTEKLQQLIQLKDLLG